MSLTKSIEGRLYKVGIWPEVGGRLIAGLRTNVRGGLRSVDPGSCVGGEVDLLYNTRLKHGLQCR